MVPEDVKGPERIQRCVEFVQSHHFAQVPNEWISAHLVRQPTVALEQRYGVKVFSLRNWDVLLAWLDDLEAGMTERAQIGGRRCVCVSPDTSRIIDGTLPTASYPADRCHNDQSGDKEEEFRQQACQFLSVQQDFGNAAI
jgi:hypothetical protein